MATRTGLKYTNARDVLATREETSHEERVNQIDEQTPKMWNLIAKCIKPSARSKEINGRALVLRDGQLFVDFDDEEYEDKNLYMGYNLPYPGTSYEGLVSNLMPISPVSNWVYVDRKTYQLKCGTESEADGNLTGPFHCNGQNHHLSFMDWEGFCVAEKDVGGARRWAVYFDVKDNGLKGKIPEGIRVLEIELTQREKQLSAQALQTSFPLKSPERVDSGFSEPDEDMAAVEGLRPSSITSSAPSGLAITLSYKSPTICTAQEYDTYPYDTQTPRPPTELIQRPTLSLLRAPEIQRPQTIVKVYPPVIISTYRLPSSSKSSRRSKSSTQTSTRQRVHNPLNKTETKSPPCDITLPNFSRPLSLSLTSSILDSHHSKKSSRIKGILRRLSGSRRSATPPDWTRPAKLPSPDTHVQRRHRRNESNTPRTPPRSPKSPPPPSPPPAPSKFGSMERSQSHRRARSFGAVLSLPKRSLSLRRKMPEAGTPTRATRSMETDRRDSGVGESAAVPRLYRTPRGGHAKGRLGELGSGEQKSLA